MAAPAARQCHLWCDRSASSASASSTSVQSCTRLMRECFGLRASAHRHAWNSAAPPNPRLQEAEGMRHQRHLPNQSLMPNQSLACSMKQGGQQSEER